MSKNKKDLVIDNKVAVLNQKLKDNLIFESLKENLLKMRDLFKDDDTFVTREFENNYDPSLKYGLIYCNGLIDAYIVNENLIKPLMTSSKVLSKDKIITELLSHVITISEIKKTNKIKDIIENITYGDIALFIDGVDEVLLINTKKFFVRPVTEPVNEQILVGPREGFNEYLYVNLSLVRRKLRTNDLKFKYLTLGDKTNTQVCLGYIDSIVDKKILKLLYKRLKNIKIDGVLDVNYLTELIRDNSYTPFRSTGYTEKPDTIVGKLLEGRIAIFVDGSPVVLTVPFLFVENFQSSEDYYLNFFYSFFTRLIRILGFFFTIAVPAIYIAIVAFHHEMIPTPLLINVAIERESAPLPASVELPILLFVFDILRETGIRMPSNIGQALSIVGALVIGQAAVEAKLVAAPIIIVVAFTGITALLVPKLNAPIVFVRIILFFLSASFGLVGLVCGLALLFIHILNLKSFGVSQLNLDGQFKFQNIKDQLFRAPWGKMKRRPPMLAPGNVKRMSKAGVKN
ncbi:MAG: spore germination protein [Bacilli bacterium]|nr:spore germination protein [Bacilli bacterium]MDD3304893.1 spore germination protein [Bacilli bacterium]MDD4053507.1 spore germination protein [Bacilli bacterium]MDD4411542.1 spore germination protein [Bacilli bacterium]